VALFHRDKVTLGDVSDSNLLTVYPAPLTLPFKFPFPSSSIHDPLNLRSIRWCSTCFSRTSTSVGLLRPAIDDVMYTSAPLPKKSSFPRDYASASSTLYFLEPSCYCYNRNSQRGESRVPVGPLLGCGEPRPRPTKRMNFVLLDLKINTFIYSTRPRPSKIIVYL
jgi:hypothetical protein